MISGRTTEQDFVSMCRIFWFAPLLVKTPTTAEKPIVLTEMNEIWN